MTDSILALLILYPTGPSPEEVTVGMERNERRLYLATGDKLTIALPADSATGYVWTPDPGMPKILEPAGKPTFAEGSARFTYKAVGLGRFWQRMVYLRPGSKAPPAKVFSVMVRVVVAESRKLVSATMDDHDERKLLAYGETLDVRLPLEPGYVWNPNVPSSLRQVGPPHAEDGSLNFRFRVAHSGLNDLVFAYRRPGTPAVKTFRLEVLVPRPWSGVSPLE